MDQTSVAPTQTLPTAAIISIAIGCYIVVVGLLLILRQCLMDRGVFSETCCLCCGEGEGLDCCKCGECCMMYCNCCGSPDMEACCDSICPTRRRMDCADIIMCQCCMDNECCQCCYSEEPLCDCGACNCQMQSPDCSSINCCCFELKLNTPPPINGWICWWNLTRGMRTVICRHCLWVNLVKTEMAL